MTASKNDSTTNKASTRRTTNSGKAANDAVTSVSCPTCNKTVVWSSQSPYRPFCSDRCRLIDLGEWASESHRIAGDDNDLMSGDLPPNY